MSGHPYHPPPPTKGNGNSEGRGGLNRDNSVGLEGGLSSLLFPGLRVRLMSKLLVSLLLIDISKETLFFISDLLFEFG